MCECTNLHSRISGCHSYTSPMRFIYIHHRRRYDTQYEPRFRYNEHRHSKKPLDNDTGSEVLMTELYMDIPQIPQGHGSLRTINIPTLGLRGNDARKETGH